MNRPLVIIHTNLHSPSHVGCVILLLLVTAFVASSLPLAGVGMTCTGSYDAN